MTHYSRRLSFAVLASAVLLCAGQAVAQAPAAGAAQAFPNKAVRIVVPFPPGGSADATARIIGERMSAAWSQPVLVENKPGAGTTLGAAFVADSAPDGYVLFFTGSLTHAASSALFRNPGYDALKSFAPVGLVSASPFVLVVHPSVKANTVKELVELAKTKPGGLTYASSGSGTSGHLVVETFALATGVKAVHVPFKGTSPALVAILGGQVDFMISDIVAMAHVRTGKLRALAVTSAKQSALAPGIPTMQEAGVPTIDASSAMGLLAPAGTPRDVVTKINGQVRRALAEEEVKRRLNAQGFEPTPGSPEEHAAIMQAEVHKYAKLIKDTGVKVD
jgi:tripartite-type tricarboxylate transporter receptor subunit TctC